MNDYFWQLKRNLIPPLLLIAVVNVLLFPVYALASGPQPAHRLRESINSGGGNHTDGSLKLQGSVESYDTRPISNGHSLLPGPQNIFYYPEPVNDLSLNADNDTTVSLSWTAPRTGVNYNEQVMKYDIFYSLVDFTNNDLQNISKIPHANNPTANS